jgi:iron complex outermembrane recepter protein
MNKARVFAATAFMSAAMAHAAETALPTTPPVTVTATRIDDVASRHLIGGRVVTADDIARSRATTLPELLQSIPELRRRELPNSPNTLVDLRGFGSFGDQNTLVLRDGVRLREYEQLTVNWAAIPLASVERIEILPASSAVLYGSGAIGGGINIVTKAARANSRGGYAGGGLASYGTREVSAGASARGDIVAVRGYGSHFEAEGYRDNSRVRIDNAQGDLRWAGDARSLTLKLGADDQLNGIPGILTEAQIAANRRQSATLGDVATQRGHYATLAALSDLGQAHVVADLTYRQRETAAALLVRTPRASNVETEVRGWTFTPRVRLKPSLVASDDDFIAGFDWDDWTFDATAGPAVVSKPHSTQRSSALYGHYAFTWPTQTRIAIGAREQRARYGAEDIVNRAAAGTLRRTLHAWDLSVRQVLGPAVSLYVRRGASFRLPNVNDNFNQTLARLTLLEPQTAREWEAGMQGGTGPLRYSVSAYRAELDNEIFFDPVTLGSRNRLPTDREALELDARLQAHSTLDLYANATWTDARFRTGTVRDVPISGKRVPLAPRLLLSSGARWAFASRAHAVLDVRYSGPMIFDSDEANTFGREIAGYTLVDLRLAMRERAWALNAGIRNVFDRKYLGYGVFTGRPTYSAFPAQQRTFFVSAQYTLP